MGKNDVRNDKDEMGDGFGDYQEEDKDPSIFQDLKMSKSERKLMNNLIKMKLMFIDKQCDDMRRFSNSQPNNDKLKQALIWFDQYRACYEQKNFQEALTLALQMIQAQMNMGLYFAGEAYMMLGLYSEARAMALRATKKGIIVAAGLTAEIEIFYSMRMAMNSQEN